MHLCIYLFIAFIDLDRKCMYSSDDAFMYLFIYAFIDLDRKWPIASAGMNRFISPE